MAVTQIGTDSTVKTRTSGIRLRADAAASFDAVSDELFATRGWRLAPTDGFRSFDIQKKIFLERYDPKTSGTGPYGDVRYWNSVRYVRMRGYAAAVPGTSNHGGGIAIDAGAGVNSYGTRWNEFAAVAMKHGWSHDEGKSVGEPWHWVYVRGGGTPAIGAALAVDGKLGPATISKWQGLMGTPIDGVISTPKSALVVAVQIKCNQAGATGLDGKPLVVDGRGIYSNVSKKTPKTNTQAALQQYLGTYKDGVLDSPSGCVMALQRRLNAGLC